MKDRKRDNEHLLRACLSRVRTHSHSPYKMEPAKLTFLNTGGFYSEKNLATGTSDRGNHRT